MERRLILAVALSFLAIIVYQSFMSRYYPPTTTSQKRGPGLQNQSQIAPLETKQFNRMEKALKPYEKGLEAHQIDFKEGEEVVFENDVYRVRFSTVGGNVISIKLKENPEVGLNTPYTVYKAQSPPQSIFSIREKKGISPLNFAIFNYKKFNDGVGFEHKSENGMMLRKVYKFYPGIYLIYVSYEWVNTSNKTALLQDLGITTSSYTEEKSRVNDRFVVIKSMVNGRLLKIRKKGRKNTIEWTGDTQWLFFRNRYFSNIAKPYFQPAGIKVIEEENGALSCLFLNPPHMLEKGIPYRLKIGVFLGPSRQDLLKSTNLGLEEVLRPGFFESISHLLMSALRFYHSRLHSWGIAIILLSLTVNALLFPLTRKSYMSMFKSMKDLQVLQPKIQRLREIYKDEPQKLQKEMMELYRKHKVNPMGGCFPLLLQMPIFFALYQGLMRSLELRNSPFLWIKDLSRPERLPLPFRLPILGDAINILPLIMIGAMYIQQSLSSKYSSYAQTPEQRQQQKFTSLIMTVVLGIIFYRLPSGLVLYWLTNTVVMSISQFTIMRGLSGQK